MDWSASGICNKFEYEALDDSLAHVAWLDNITGGSIAESYRGDWRVTGAVSYDGEFPDYHYIRIWHVAELGDEVERTCLATLMPYRGGDELLYGRYTGEAELYSAMRKFERDIRGVNKSIPKTEKIVDTWIRNVGGSGAHYIVGSGVNTSKTWGKAFVYPAGEDLLAESMACADALNAYMEVDQSGNVVLVPYVAPAKRAATWSLDSGLKSMLRLGVSRETPEIVNRIVMRYEGTSQTYVSYAEPPLTHPWHYKNLGRKESELIEVQTPGSGDGWLRKMVDAEMAQRLAAKSRYEVGALFHPAVRPGTVGLVRYADSPDAGELEFKAFCSQREIQLDAGMEVTLTLEEM